MPANIVVPEVGESIVDARVAKWLKKQGDVVSAGDPLVELETDKIDRDVEQAAQGAPAGAQVSARQAAGAVAPPAAPAPQKTRPATPVAEDRRRAEGDRSEERVRMSKRRATIARRLVEVQSTAAMLTT